MYCIYICSVVCVNFIVSLSTTAVVKILLHMRPVFTRNLSVCFLLQFKLPYFMEEPRSANLMFLSWLGSFKKHFSSHNRSHL